MKTQVVILYTIEFFSFRRFFTFLFGASRLLEVVQSASLATSAVLVEFVGLELVLDMLVVLALELKGEGGTGNTPLG